MDSIKLIAGTSRAQKVSEVEVGIDQKMVDSTAEITTTVIVQKYGDAIGATRDEVKEVNVVGLQAALMKAIDGEAKIPRGVVIPSYFSAMIRGLECKLGRTVVCPTLVANEIAVSEAYKVTVMKMKAVGITMVNPHRPSELNSQTLALSREIIDDVEVVCGNLDSIALAEIVRRCLLKVDAESEALLRSLVGELSLQYGEVDTLLCDYFAAEARVALS